MIHPARCPVCDGTARVWCVFQATEFVLEMVCASCHLWSMRQVLKYIQRRSA